MDCHCLVFPECGRFARIPRMLQDLSWTIPCTSQALRCEVPDHADQRNKAKFSQRHRAHCQDKPEKGRVGRPLIVWQPGRPESFEGDPSRLEGTRGPAPVLLTVVKVQNNSRHPHKRRLTQPKTTTQSRRRHGRSHPAPKPPTPNQPVPYPQ